MHTRYAVALSALTLCGLGCHGSNYQPAVNNSVRSAASPPADPRETTSVSGAMGTPGEGRAATTNSTPATNAAATPPPSAGTSTPTKSTDAFKPGNEPPASIGGGPKAETGGAVFGDGNEGNTGAVKGGDGSAPGK